LCYPLAPLLLVCEDGNCYPMTEFKPSETYSPTSNDRLLLLSSQRLQDAFAYGTIAHTASDVQDVDNSPAISMGPYLIISGQTELLRSISIYSERGKSREQVRLLYKNAAALGVWKAMGKRTHIIDAQKTPPRTAQLAYGVPFSE
jgi:hypothetical protein